MSNNIIDQLCIDSLRTISVEEITKASSGHPGIALGAAPIIHTLFSRVLNIYPNDGNWINRDRFILAAGHGSSLLYATLHVSGYNISSLDLEAFRQFGSITAGHPELGLTPGVDATSGPLGQGIPEGVGMCIGESFLANRYNREEIKLVDHFTYVLCGDGDLQEGVTVEAASLAGHLGLGKLIVLYDSNDVQLDGPVSLANSENTKGKFEAMNWQYLLVKDGESVDDIEEAIKAAQKETNKPTIIEIKTVIGKGAKLQGTSAVHGKPLSQEEVNSFRSKLNADAFTAPKEVYDYYKERMAINEGAYENWINLRTLYSLRYPKDYEEYTAVIENKIEINIDNIINYDESYVKSTRFSSGKFIEGISKQHPTFIGGSADLTGSTFAKGADGDFTKGNRSGRNINFGVREHAMAAICNGIALHGGLKVFCGAFFVFSDYLKPAVRLAALMNLPVTYVFSHDSIAVGEDGPTHEPIEQITMLRSIPNVNVIRPADVNEVKEAYKIALESTSNPTILVLSRQDLKTVTCGEDNITNRTSLGGYILSKENGPIDGILIASGSELSLALDVQKQLEYDNIYTRVVSMPSTNLFDKMPVSYRNEVLPNTIRKRMAIEMSDATHMYKYVGLDGYVFNITTFGKSGKANILINEFGFTAENVVKVYKSL